VLECVLLLMCSLTLLQEAVKQAIALDLADALRVRADKADALKKSY